MHEAGLTRELVEKVTELCTKNGAQRVARVEVELKSSGHFTSDSLRFWFENLSKGTPAEGAQLDIVKIESAEAEEYSFHNDEILIKEIEVFES